MDKDLIIDQFKDNHKNYPDIILIVFPLDENFNMSIAHDKYFIKYALHHKDGDSVHLFCQDYNGKIINSPFWDL